MTVYCYGVDEHGHSGEYRSDPVSRTWRYGYQIGDEKPRFLGTKSNKEDARRAGLAAALEVRTKLRELGVSLKVTTWTQCRTATTETEYSEPSIEDLP